jgi:AraC-like DNA-binding protein
LISELKAVQHIEFFHIKHFDNNYRRVPPAPALGPFIDFFWETKFEELWNKYPRGFSDAQLPNIGYTYIMNLGTPFVMQVGNKKIAMKTDGFLPRYNAIECFHKPGNRLFGIKFRISPVILEKKINFSEYRNYIYPLSYLLEQSVIDKVKKARSFENRITLLSEYFGSLLAKHEDVLQPAKIVSAVMDNCFQQNDFVTSVEEIAAGYNISARTLHRYFESCTGISTKQALQMMRIRKATAHIANDPASFDYSLFGYYDESHFYKHLKQFLQENTLKNMQPYLDLLSKRSRSERGMMQNKI